MSNVSYTRDFRLRVAREASLPENEGMDHVIANKYGIMPWTVKRWREHYLEYGEKSFYKGYTNKTTRSPREIELEKENKALKEEVEILKKAATFLANAKLD